MKKRLTNLDKDITFFRKETTPSYRGGRALFEVGEEYFGVVHGGGYWWETNVFCRDVISNPSCPNNGLCDGGG